MIDKYGYENVTKSCWSTWHLTPDTWYMTLDNWHVITYLICFHMVLVHLTWCCDTWLDTITPDICITLHIHDYYFYGDLSWLLYCYQTFGTLELLILYSWYYTPVNSCNWIIMDIRLLYTPCGHNHWTIYI